MPSPRRLPYEDRLEELLGVYRQAQAALVAQIEAALRSGNVAKARTRAQQLAAALRTLDELGRTSDNTAARLIADAVHESAADTADIIGASASPPQEAAFAGAARDAIATLERTILGQLQDARVTVGRQVEDIYAQAGRRSTMMALLGARASRREASADLIERLHERGIRSFTDRAGREWGLARYAEMALRTTTRQAVVEGAKIRMAAQGIRIARVSRHGGSCSICAPWQGRLVSLDGTAGTFDGEAVGDLSGIPGGGPPFHPNCRHTLLPVAESLHDTNPIPDRDAPIPASQRVDITGASVRPHIEHTLEQIEKVHQVPASAPGLRAVPRNKAGNTLGQYHPQNLTIDVQPPALRPGGGQEFTFAHEMGHAVDHLVFGDPGQRTNAGLATYRGATWDQWNSDRRLAKLRDALEGTKAVRELRGMYDSTPVHAQPYLRYLLAPWEQFARAYSQWVTIRSQDRTLLAQLRDARPPGGLSTQWDDDDFKPVAEALDDLFRDEGLLK